MTQETEALELTQHEQSILDPRCWAFVTDLKRKAYAAGVAETEAKDRHYVWAEELAAERAKAAGLITALEKIKTPEGVYTRDELQYTRNVVEACIEIASEALDAYEGE